MRKDICTRRKKKRNERKLAEISPFSTNSNHILAFSEIYGLRRNLNRKNLLSQSYFDLSAIVKLLIVILFLH